MQNWCGNLAEFLSLNIQKIGRMESPAIQTENGRLSYKELFQNVNRAGNVFKAMGINTGDRILLVMRDSPLLVYAFLGAIRIGAIPAIINTMLLQREYAGYVADSKARLCLVDQVLMEKVESYRGELAVVGAAEFATAMEGSSNHADFHACDQLEPAFWQYSSGSTGRPKAVIHSHRGPIEVANRYGREILRINPDDRCFSTSRMFFGYGLGNSLLFPLMAGALSILSETVTHEKVSQIIDTFRPTLLFSVPSFYVRMLSHLKESGTDLSSVRLSISAGEALPSATYEEWLSATGIELLDGIGSTEALHIFISNRAGEVHPGSCGRPLQEVEVMLVDKQGEPVQEGDPGKLMVRYPGLALGYWQRPKLEKETFSEGWLDTRDIFRRDENGYFWHMGRSDDMFKVNGMWVSPVEVEDCLHSHPSIHDCAVIGQQNGKGLTEVVAYLVLNASATGSDLNKQFHAYLEQNLVRHKIPTRFHYVDIIPRTTTGKKKRFELTAAIAACA